MGLTRYDKALIVLKKYMEDTGKDYIYTMPLRDLIMREIAGTETIVSSTLKMLQGLGVITEVKINKWKIKI